MAPTPDLLPDWPDVKNHLWAELGILAMTSAISWGLARYKSASPFWQLITFSATELLIGLSGAAAIARFGLAAGIWSVIALLVPVAALVALDRRSGRDFVPPAPPPIQPTTQLLPPPAMTPPVSAQHGAKLLLSRDELRKRIESLPLALRKEALKGYVGSTVEWDAELWSLYQHPDGRFRLYLLCADSILNHTWAAVADSPPVRTLNVHDNLRVTGTISEESTPTEITIDPAEYVILEHGL